MATLTVEKMDRDGLEPTLAAVTPAGDEFPNDGKTFLLIKGGGGACDVTVATQVAAVNAPPGTVPASVIITVPATPAQVLAGPFPQSGFNTAAQRSVLTYDAPTGVTIAVVKMGQ